MKHVAPKHLTDLEAIELIWGPPDTILEAGHLRGYQNWMVDKIKKLPGIYLGAEMGLGKTGAVLKAVTDLMEEGEIKQVLIIAPLYVAEDTWAEEIAKWAFARHLRYRIVTGTEPERMAALRYGPCEVTIINRENLLWLLRKLGLKRWVFDMIVYDEASRLKRGATRTKPNKRADGTMSEPRLTELGVLDAVRARTKKIVELSGTPTPNGLIDLWGPMYAIDQGRRLGASMTAYKRRWFREDMWTKKVEPFDHSQEQIMEAAGDVFFSLRSEDYLDLPPLIEIDHKITLTPKVKQGYRELERESALWVKDHEGTPELIEAVNSGVLTGKLLQYANGSLYGAEGVDYPIHKAKLEVLESIYEEAAGMPILVAYSFKFDKDAILKKFSFARVYGENQNDKRDWNAGKIPMLVIHPAAAGHGLNFQFGSNISVWYGLNWSLELYQQFVKRLWRSGQKEDRVFLHRILAKGTADMDVLAALTRKGATQDSITDAVRVRLARAA